MPPYLAVHFQDTGAVSNYDQALEDQRLWAAVSEDGTTFRTVGRLLTNATITRDTSILPPSLAPDDRWHLACGNSNLYSTAPNQTVDLYSGSTLFGIDPAPLSLNCSAAKDSGTVNWVWAPEWFVNSDGTVWLIVSASTWPTVGTLLANGAFTTWAFPATNSALTTFGAPTKINFGTPSGLGFIDTYVVKVGATYYAFTKAGNIVMHTASSFPGGPWTLVHSGTQTTPGATQIGEGPNLCNMGGGTWRMYYDQWDESGVWKYTESSDTFATFSSPTNVVNPGFRMRHGHVIDLANEPPLSRVAQGGRRTQVAA